MTSRRIWSERLGRFSVRLGIELDLALSAADWHLVGRRRAETEYKAAVRKHTWCFIVGCNNSGTSLLQGVLQNSGQVSTFPHEGQRYTRALLPATRRGHERVWSEYVDELRLGSEDSVRPARRLVHDWMRKLSPPVRPTIVEKTTANAVRMPWLQQAFPNSCFIGLVRNGYAVTEGISRKGRKSIERGALHWSLVNEWMLDDASQIERFTLVKYEDLVSNPAEMSAHLAEFLSLDVQGLARATTREYELETLRGGGRQRISDMNDASISRLSASEIEVIRRVAGPMLTRLGYDVGGARPLETTTPPEACCAR